MITLLSNLLERVDELGTPDFKSNKRFETPVPVKVTLPVSAHLYNARTGRALGQAKMPDVTVTPYEPLILVSSPASLPTMFVSSVATAKRGSDIDLGIAFQDTPAETHVVHIDVLDPNGNRMLQYSGNLLAKHRKSAKHIPLAMNDPTGQCTVRIHDVLSGRQKLERLISADNAVSA